MKTKNVEVNGTNLTELTVQTAKHVAALNTLGSEIIRLTTKTGTAYLDLCLYIRANQLAHKLVSHQLSELGFHRTRISEINRVAMASDANFNEFQARVIGFEKVLELERGNVVDILATESHKDKEEVASDAKELAEEGTEVATKMTLDKQARKLDKALVAVLRAAELENVKKRTAEANGWTVTVSKIKGWKAPKKDSVKPEPVKLVPTGDPETGAVDRHDGGIPIPGE